MGVYRSQGSRYGSPHKKGYSTLGLHNGAALLVETIRLACFMLRILDIVSSLGGRWGCDDVQSSDDIAIHWEFHADLFWAYEP